LRLLLDTHVALWAVLGDRRLAPPALNLIADLENDISVSVVTLWEIGIKFALRRGSPSDMPIAPEQALDYFGQAGYDVLPITERHALVASRLPPLHRDPFDRMLVAQARHEQLRLLTADRRLATYGDSVDLV